jgi:crotonobetainyl-CoA:carnitine CoA-transferase CaiB-like acyl-CoA transferase
MVERDLPGAFDFASMCQTESLPAAEPWLRDVQHQRYAPTWEHAPQRMTATLDTKNSGPLQGIRVVEMGIWVAGPATAAVLGDWGADVIKIENPAGGDPVRGMLALGIPVELPVNPTVELDNRNKRSVAINVHTPAGREAVRRMLRTADVFVTNLRAAALQRAGLSYADVRSENPRLIYAVISGYGARGPEKDRAAYDYAAFWARAGAMASLGEPDCPPPSQRPAMGDHPTGLALAGAVSAALYHRERTGEGQEIHLSLFQFGIWMMATDIESYLVTGMLPPLPAGRRVVNPLWNHYRAQDGRWFHLVMLQSDRYWPGLCAAIERPDLIDDARYGTALARAQQHRELIALLDAVFETRPLAAWGEVFDQQNLVWAPVQTLQEVTQDAQAHALDAFATVPHRSGTDIKVVRSPVEFGATPATIRRTGPELGEHTEEVLLEHGYTWDEIAQLKEQGAIG